MPQNLRRSLVVAGVVVASLAIAGLAFAATSYHFSGYFDGASHQSDAFQFKMTAGTVVTMKLDCTIPGETLDTFVSISGPGGYSAQNDDSSPNNCINNWGSKKTVTIPKDGVYVVTAMTYEFANDSPDAPYSDGYWNLTVRCDPDCELLGIDSRINNDSMAGPVALYCDGDVLQVYDVNPETAGGVLAFEFSDWSSTAPAQNTLVDSKGGTQLWHLASGEYQVNARYSNEYGKIYAFVFNGCPYNGGGYNVNLDPNDGLNH